MLIDATDERLKEYNEYLKKQLVNKKLQVGKYTAEDIMLIRVSDHLPENGVIKAVESVPLVLKLTDLSNYVIDQFFKKEGLDYDEYKELARKYTPYSTQYRSTVHFCLNGIVGSHSMGNFDGRPFVIIEPFSEHENDSNLLAVRGEDTYFKHQIKISNKATIMVDERYADKIVDSDVKDRYNIVLYRGNQENAVNSYLLSIGIVPELIGANYIIGGNTAPLIDKFIEEKGYSRQAHNVAFNPDWCSESYREDDEKNIILWKIYRRNFYTYLYKIVYGDITEKQQEIEQLIKGDAYDRISPDILIRVIEEAGLENYKKIVNDYNEAIERKIEEGNYPTNVEILEGAPLNFTDEIINSNKKI